ncbi:unnamed protein product [Paramecium primaurelia]|uniref:Uncharacterized protein n=1 Tax=Paramecium primaurelia TaxID=5886 RepID=A0A8S1NFP1_PARPR|nr:unnamed protein product [Paramecium primaurelia]
MSKICQKHKKYEEKFICIHKTRLQKEGNKFSCIKCLNWKKSDDYLKSIDDVEEEAKQNVAKYVEMQSKIINSNNEMKQKYLQSLTELYHKLNQYFENQQKSITSLVEQQNQILTQNINQANSLLNEQSVLDSQSIDNFIIFTTLNETTQKIIENKYVSINKCLERQFNYEFAEIQCKVNQFTTLEFKFDSIPKYEVEQFKILTVDKKKDKIPYCEEHQMKKIQICTYEDCLEEQKQEYLCSDCAKNNHEQHSKGKFIKTLQKIKIEQNEKLKLIEEQYQILQQEVENRIDKELTANQQQQQEIFVNSQKIRENLKYLEAQSKINPFNKNPNFIYNNINQNLLSYDSDMIKQEFQSKLAQLEQLKQQITKIKKEEFQQQCQTTEEQSLTAQQEAFKQKKLVQQYELQISELQKKLEINSNQSLMIEIKNAQNQLIDQTFKEQQKQFIEGINEIISQIQTVSKVVTESKHISSLQQDLKNAITTINQINSQSYLIPTLQQELKTSTNSLEGIKSQITNLTNLNQDLKVIQKGMDEIKSQIQTVSKVVTESKHFSSLQQDLKNAITTINQINSQSSLIPTLQQELKTSTNSQEGIKSQITNLTNLNQDLKVIQQGMNEIKSEFQIENKHISSLQQDLKNAITTINQINSQSSLIPTLQQELKTSTNSQEGIKSQITNLTNLNQDLKVIQQGMNEIKSEFQIENKHISSFQSDLKNAITTFNQIDSQCSLIPPLQQDLKYSVQVQEEKKIIPKAKSGLKFS